MSDVDAAGLVRCQKTITSPELPNGEQLNPPGAAVAASDTEWRCPRAARQEDKYCLFHDHETDAESAEVSCPVEKTQVLVDLINGETEAREWNEQEPSGLWEISDAVDTTRQDTCRLQFIGASFGSLDLSRQLLDGPDNNPIDLRLSTFDELDLSAARVRHQLYLDGSHQRPGTGPVKFHATRFDSDISLTAASLSGAQGISVKQATIEGSLLLDALSARSGPVFVGPGTTVDGRLSLEQSAVTRVYIGRSTGTVDIGGDLLLSGLLANRLVVDSVLVGGKLQAEWVTLGRTCKLHDLSVTGTTSLGNCSAYCDVTIEDTDFGGSVSAIRFATTGDVTLSGVHIGGAVTFEMATMDGCLDLSHAEIQGTVTVETTVVGSLDLRDGVISGGISVGGCLVDGNLLADGLTAPEIRVAGNAPESVAQSAWAPLVIGRVSLCEVTCERLRVDLELYHPAVNAIPVRGAEIDTGTIAVSPPVSDDRYVYDFARAEISEITFVRGGEENEFKSVRFLETKFNGFRFSLERGKFRATDWRIHEPRQDGYRDIAIVSQTIEPAEPHTESSEDNERVVFDEAQSRITSDGTFEPVSSEPEYELTTDTAEGERGDPISRFVTGLRQAVTRGSHQRLSGGDGAFDKQDVAPPRDRLPDELHRRGISAHERARLSQKLARAYPGSDSGASSRARQRQDEAVSFAEAPSTREELITNHAFQLDVWERHRVQESPIPEQFEWVARRGADQSAIPDLINLAEPMVFGVARANVMSGEQSEGTDQRGESLRDPDDEQLKAQTQWCHDMVDPSTIRGSDGELESTYAEAKNDASAVGDETAAGNFFQREATFARYQHWQQWRRGFDGVWAFAALCLTILFTAATIIYAGSLGYSLLTTAPTPLADRPVWLVRGILVLLVVGAIGFGYQTKQRVDRPVSPLFRWVANLFLGATMGYGEKPTRVLLFAGLIIFAFAGIYSAAAVDIEQTPAYPGLNYLVLSFDLFVTLGLGDPNLDGALIRLLAVVEGFLGVFVIGMFVVAVTRAVHR